MVASRLLRLMPVGLLILSAEANCAASQAAGSQAEGKSMNRATEATIGTATEEPDGTLVLSLRATGPGGAIGDGMKRYPPDDPNYAAVRRHVGPIPRGGSVAVRPFP